MKKAIIGSLAALLILTTVGSPVSAYASNNGVSNTSTIEEEELLEILDTDIKIISSDDSGSVYQYTEDDGKTYEVIEKSSEDSNGKATINTQIFDITSERVLIEDFVTTVESNDDEIIIDQDGDITHINSESLDEVEEEEQFFTLASARKSGGSGLTSTTWVTFSGNSKYNAYATIYPGNQKKAKQSNTHFKTFKSKANAVKSAEVDFAKAGLLGVAEEVAKFVFSGKGFTVETIKKLLKASGKKVPIIGTAVSLFNWSSNLKAARKAHGQLPKIN